MTDRTIDIGIVTDEVAPDVAEALEIGMSWGLRRFELREGGTRRFPFFTRQEVAAVEAAIGVGAVVTAVSPGVLKGAADDEARVRHELEKVLPRTFDLALRFACPRVIVFGFERYAGEADGNRLRVMKAFEHAAERAAAAGLTVAVENEPNFWIDRPEATATLLREIGHPALRLNWDPANVHWGGRVPTYDEFCALQPHLDNLHVKDYYPDNPEAPWVPVGTGETPWAEILAWIVAETTLQHLTLETHCVPLLESSQRSLEYLRRLLDDVLAAAP